MAAHEECTDDDCPCFALGERSRAMAVEELIVRVREGLDALEQFYGTEKTAAEEHPADDHARELLRQHVMDYGPDIECPEDCNCSHRRAQRYLQATEG